MIYKRCSTCTWSQDVISFQTCYHILTCNRSDYKFFPMNTIYIYIYIYSRTSNPKDLLNGQGRDTTTIKFPRLNYSNWTPFWQSSFIPPLLFFFVPTPFGGAVSSCPVTGRSCLKQWPGWSSERCWGEAPVFSPVPQWVQEQLEWKQHQQCLLPVAVGSF